MQVAAALPTVALLAGSAFGLLVPSLPLSIGFAILGLASAAAIWSWRESHVWPLAVSVGIAFTPIRNKPASAHSGCHDSIAPSR